MSVILSQNKEREIAFFDSHGASKAYDVFTPDTNERIIDIVARLGGFTPGARIADLGCGSGVFTGLLNRRGFACTGVDLSPKLIRIAREAHPGIDFQEGDIERLPFADDSFDGVLLAGVLHHLPELSKCAAEIKRILRPGGRFVAFDPNRMNPAMYLYRDRSSPLYSSVGVTENERPVIARNLTEAFTAAGFKTGTEFHSGMKYRYLASGALRWLLPAYNLADSVLFAPAFMAPWRSFVFTYGQKPKAAP
ncbi:class I SAM-dependent methyltransferase [Undibacter mobilis]|uniref:Class I SAM-dependent methyltransferase n=1 Tax=Undibacter mobilis TaxID=2292256 RepID=A0A371B7Y8_9BRAD|nr:class I SAM-dependent methyltransferase [Undibacter mobilis]RDV03617.1 class I SAM-dependent methyltransferase [Undibacter mobilis]